MGAALVIVIIPVLLVVVVVVGGLVMDFSVGATIGAAAFLAVLAAVVYQLLRFEKQQEPPDRD